MGILDERQQWRCEHGKGGFIHDKPSYVSRPVHINVCMYGRSVQFPVYGLQKCGLLFFFLSPAERVIKLVETLLGYETRHLYSIENKERTNGTSPTNFFSLFPFHSIQDGILCYAMPCSAHLTDCTFYSVHWKGWMERERERERERELRATELRSFARSGRFKNSLSRKVYTVYCTPRRRRMDGWSKVSF